MELVREVKPAQATLVPDPPDVLTSNAGWDTIEHKTFLQEIILELKNQNIRTSLFIDPDLRMIEGAAQAGTDRIELYTEMYASQYVSDKLTAIKSYKESAHLALELSLGLNAGHDLDLNNLKFLKSEIPSLAEVSIGHALVCDAIYLGLENTIQLYLNQLR